MPGETMEKWKEYAQELTHDKTVTTFEAFIRELLQKLVSAVEIDDGMDLSPEEYQAFAQFVSRIVLDLYQVEDLNQAMRNMDEKNPTIGGDGIHGTWDWVRDRAITVRSNT